MALLVAPATLLLGACGSGPDEAPEPAPTETVARPVASTTERAGVPAPAIHVSEPVLRSETGAASFYADVFEGKRTASGERFRQSGMVAAHRRYPFGTILRVTNLDNDRSVRVRVIDRGPFAAPWKSHRRIIDLSRAAARRLGFLDAGFAPVKVEVLRYGKGLRAA
jgi:rare lipoprotein A